MVVCELDSEVSGEILGWSLPAWQALLLHRVLPSCGGLLLYLVVMCYDLALVYEHFQDGEKSTAVFSLVLMCLPALLSLTFTLASPPPGLRPEYSAFSVDLKKNDVCWVFTQILNFFIFPLATIGRYCHQIFWWIEAVCASWITDDERARDAVIRARQPSPVELYLFLQSFVHSAPNAILNIVQMMNWTSDGRYDKFFLQSVSIVASSLRMACTATLYRRFEREKISGRKYPWNLNSADLDNATNANIEKQNISTDSENIYERVLPRNRPNSSPYLNGNRKHSSDLIQFSPSIRSQKFLYNSASASESENEYVVPTPQINNLRYNSDSEDEYVKPKSIIERVAPRRDTQYTIESVEIVPPPIMPAPRMTWSLWADKMVENAESIPTWLSAPPRRRQHQEVILEEPDLPRRVPRRFMRGLEPQDATAYLVNFLGWYMFFVSRLLSLSAFIVFYPVVAVIVLIAHYKIVLLLLIVPPASAARRSFYVFLSFIYLFCLMEFKIRFRHVRAWHVSWIVVMSAETVIFTGLWATIDNPLSSWWRQYVVTTIFGSLMLSYMCMLVYFVILKPKETIVYINREQK